MEIDEMNNTQVKASNNLFDFDDDINDNDNGKKVEDAKKKAVKRQLVKLDANYVIDNPIGIKNLYKNFVIDKEKNL